MLLICVFKRGKTPVARRLARRIFLQGHEELAGDDLHGAKHEGAVDHPVVIGVRVVLRLLERVAPQVEEQRQAQLDERLAPDLQLTGAVLQIDRLPVADADGGDLAAVIHIDELLAGRLRLRRCLRRSRVIQHVVAIDVVPVGAAVQLHALRSFSLMSGAPAAAAKVGSQSSWATMPLSVTPAGNLPGQRTNAGTR